jgi:hypothetical protein
MTKAAAEAWERERETRELAELERLAAVLIVLFATHPPVQTLDMHAP